MSDEDAIHFLVEITGDVTAATKKPRTAYTRCGATFAVKDHPNGRLFDHVTAWTSGVTCDECLVSDR